MSDRGRSTVEWAGFDLVNEFAAVRLELDEEANGPRLLLTDLVTGGERYLDPLDVQSILWLTFQDLDRLVDPSQNGWQDLSSMRPARHRPWHGEEDDST